MNSPLPQMVERLGTAIANAQYAMDRNSVQIATMMGDREEHGIRLGGENRNRSLLELGFTPSFYQITEATIDARVAFSMSESREVSLSVGVEVGVNVYFVMVAASVNASYTNKYSFEASGSSAITTKFVAVPPPTILTNLLGNLSKKQLEESES